MLANGVCSGEVHVFKERGALEGDRPMGHEASGVLVEVGRRARGFRAGDIVTVLGGPFAEYFLCAPAAVVACPPGVDPRWALGEPVACCVHAMNRSRIAAGCRVAVVGCGFMGLVCLQLARHVGATWITAIDMRDERLQRAREFGADEALSPQAALPDEARGRCAVQGEYDVVVEAAGTASALELATYLVRQHGLINVVGYHQSDGGLRTIRMGQWNWKAIDVVIGHVRRNDEKLQAMRQGVDLAARGVLRLAPLVTCYPLGRIQQAFTDCADLKPGVYKAVIVPDEPSG
jgi:threonine dehydrogenase-like Zn-dependent dehydrogenase